MKNVLFTLEEICYEVTEAAAVGAPNVARLLNAVPHELKQRSYQKQDVHQELREELPPG